MTKPSHSSLSIIAAVAAVALTASMALGACSSGSDSAGAGNGKGSSASTAAPGKRATAPIGQVELPPLEFNAVDNNGTVSADITSEALFDFDSAELKPAAQEVVDQIAQKLSSQSSWVRVDGFTDGKGSESHNIELSQRRADALATKIKELGTAQEVQSCGRGEQGTDGESEDPTARRVVVTISLSPLPGDCQ